MQIPFILELFFLLILNQLYPQQASQPINSFSSQIESFSLLARTLFKPFNMHFNTITIKALAACALLTSPVLGRAVPELESNPQSSALDLTVKFWDTTTCKTSGPKRQYNSGTCLPLPESTHAVSIQDKRAGCYSEIFPLKFKNSRVLSLLTMRS